MTEMPANTARPIGSTDSFLPGIANAAVANAVDDADESAWLAAAAVAEAADVEDAGTEPKDTDEVTAPAPF